MADFGFVKEQGVSPEDLIEFTIYTITMPNGKHPTLVGRYAGESNKPYYNALLKKQMKTVSAKQAAFKAGTINEEMVGENREQNRELFPEFVLTGWRDVTDGKGKDLKFTKADCFDFLCALPNEDCDDVFNHFSNRVNFKKDVPTVETAVDEGNA